MSDEQAEVLPVNENNENEDFILQIFVSALPTGFSKNDTINNMLNSLQYVFKYTRKAEPRSLAFSEILDRALYSNSSNNSLIIAFQKLLLHTQEINLCSEDLISFAINSLEENCNDSSNDNNMQETNENDKDYEEN
ncbi:10532_t:CDS:2 [Cetraspora pellucida]|uniref:10532_t:CDS:1 n=1 Tax=Cetraspora pellucida TaxID=1433469 RepID=A0A9N8ZQA8_9GLOM|nr:10532_t:CDS:2 [Cetraspora pellucida]